MNILLTGITGFVGSHMVDYLLENTDAVVYGVRRWRSRDENIQHFYGNPRVIFVEADLLDQGSLLRAVKISKPDYVFHFASQSYPMSSFITPVHTLMTNVIGTTNLLEAIKTARESDKHDPTIVSVSSSEVYGMPREDEIPIKETNPIRAANPYSISKVGHDLMSQYYHMAYGLKVIITRMFSHEGSRRGKQFALSNFARQIVSNEKTGGLIPTTYFMGTKECKTEGKYIVKVGNLNSVRTYAHVLDAVNAYWLAATKGKIGDIYNIGGNHTCTVGDALNNLLEKSTIPRTQVSIVVDPHKIRPTDITLQIPDCSKFKEQTGWETTKTLDDINEDLLNYWREILK